MEQKENQNPEMNHQKERFNRYIYDNSLDFDFKNFINPKDTSTNTDYRENGSKQELRSKEVKQSLDVKPRNDHFHPISGNRTFVNKEIKLDPSKNSMSKTDPFGVVEYANQDFMNVCGYEEYELMGQQHNIVRHPDMPKLIFKFMWGRLHEGKDLFAIVKNRAKDGRYYWVIAKLSTKFDEQGKIISHFAHRKAAPNSVVYKAEKLYKKIKEIEDNVNVEVAERFFNGLLEEKGMSYDEFILDLIGVKESELLMYFKVKETPKKPKSFFSRLFK